MRHYLPLNMVIAVYVDFRFYEASDVDRYFINGLLNKLAAALTGHKIHLITPVTEHGLNDSPLSIIPLNVKAGVVYRYRLQTAIDKVAKEIKMDVLLSFDAVFKIDYPQVLFLTGLKMKKQIPIKSLQKAKKILVPTQKLRSGLVEQYNINPQKVQLLYGGPSGLFAALSDENRSLIKERYTGGKEYFIFRGTITKTNNIIPLLKAFSFFKKRQKSVMKMVLVGTLAGPHNEIEKLLNTYKYREDVVVVNKATEEQEAELVASAYAYIQPYAGGNLSFVFDAIQSGVPVLIDADSPLQNMNSEAAVYFESTNDNDIAHKMMWIYKDESLTRQLIGKGNDFIKEYNWQKTFEALQASLQL